MQKIAQIYLVSKVLIEKIKYPFSEQSYLNDFANCSEDSLSFFPNPTLHYVVREANTVAHELPELHVQFTIEKKRRKKIRKTRPIY